MSDDADLEARVRSGSQSSLAAYVDCQRPRLIAHIHHRMGADLRRRIDAEDVLQETLVSAFSQMRMTDLKDRDLFRWLCRIAEIRLIDMARHHRAAKRSTRRDVSAQAPAGNSSRTGAHLGDLLAASLTTPSGAAMRDEREAKLNALLAELPSGLREMLRLRFAEGLGSREIAEKLGKTDEAVRAAVSRALRQLQAKLRAANA
jgi:RNA polymerase sigma-70 factor (subfamily 1)